MDYRHIPFTARPGAGAFADMGDVRLMLGDCLERMGEIADGSVDLIAADLPYGTTACKWDSVIPLEPMWAAFRRILGPAGAVVLTAGQPFTSMLVVSNLEWFRHDTSWNKMQPTGHLNSRSRPLKICDSVLLFSPGKSTFNPQMGVGPPRSRTPGGNQPEVYGDFGPNGRPSGLSRYPTNLLSISSGRSPHRPAIHPTQKPVALFEYLIRTYSNEAETVLDCTMGSGTTGVACVNTGRNFIGIERDPAYFAIAERRISEARTATPLLA